MVHKRKRIGKKGIGGDIDWIIAMGIFLIFMGMVFTLFKPGIRPSFDYKSLHQIVEENFLNDTKWEIYKQPIFIEDTNLEPPYSEGTSPNEKRCSKTSVCTSPNKFGSKPFVLDGSTYKANEDPPVSTDNNFPLFTSFFPGKNATEVKQRTRVYYITEGEKGGGVTTNAVLNVNFHDITGMAAAGGNNQAPNNDKDNECTRDQDCGRGKLCFSDKCVDPPKKAVGESCSNGEECASNICESSLCVPKSRFKRGHICTVPAECIQGLTCDSQQKKCCAQNTGDPQRCNREGGKRDGGNQRSQSSQGNNNPGGITNANRENLGENEIDYKIYGDDSTKKVGLMGVSFADGEQKRYTLVYSSEIINPGNVGSAEQQPSSVFKACIVSDYDTAKKVKGPDCQARYSVGVREAVHGISLKKYEAIVPGNVGATPCAGREYECLKEKWGYPLVKDFRIDMFNTDLGISFTVPKTAMNTDRTKATVRVRQFNDFILTEEGLKVPVTVSIKVW